MWVASSVCAVVYWTCVTLQSRVVSIMKEHIFFLCRQIRYIDVERVGPTGNISFPSIRKDRSIDPNNIDRPYRRAIVGFIFAIVNKLVLTIVPTTNARSATFTKLMTCFFFKKCHLHSLRSLYCIRGTCTKDSRNKLRPIEINSWAYPICTPSDKSPIYIASSVGVRRQSSHCPLYL